MKKTRIVGLALSTVAAGAVLTACTSTDHATESGTSVTVAPSGQGAHSQADVAFSQQMIPHHQQAVEMANLVPPRTGNQRVIELARQIQQAQSPEIQLMTGWLGMWGAAIPAAGMNHDGMPGGMPGMMSAADMTRLGQLKDADFDRLWLQMMIQHHQGAIDMSKTELQQGASADTKQLAQKITDGQQREITTMKGLLG